MLFVHAGDAVGQLEVVTEGRRTKEQFRNLKSEIDKELVELKKRLEGKCEIEPLLPGADSSLRDLVRKRLQDPVLQAPDVVHFSGHARTISQPQGRGERTFLVLPSSSRRLADGLSVEVYSWQPPATRLVTLSACQRSRLTPRRRYEKAWCQCSWFSVGGGGDLCDAIYGEVL